MNSLIERKSGGAVAESGSERRVSLPVIYLPGAGLTASATRFLNIPAVAETFQEGSNGYSVVAPGRPEAKLDLLRRLPVQQKCELFAHQLDLALRAPACDDDVIAAVDALVGSYRAGDRAPRAYVSAMIAELIDVAEERCWPAAAVAGGMNTICRSISFLPALSEVIEAIEVAAEQLRFAAWAAREAAILASDLHWACVDAGLIEDEGDF